MELRRILVVEDERDIREIIRISLANVGGFNVDICDSALEAMGRLQGDLPDLIILDVMMPVMDGPSFLQQLQHSERLKHIPVIFITAKVQSHEIEEYMGMGVLGVISKPFDPLGLPNQINELWHAFDVA